MTRKRCNDVYMVDGCNDHRFGCSGGCHRRSEPGRSAAGGGVAGREAQPRRGPRVVPVEGRPAVMQEVSIASCRKGLDGESTPALLVQAETSRARSRHWRRHRSGSARASRSNATKRPSWRWRACSPGREGCKIFDLRVAICVRGKDARGSGVARCATYRADRRREARRIFEMVYEQASDAQLAEATENLVRCVKAEDGSTDRVNKMVLDVRPGREGEGFLAFYLRLEGSARGCARLTDSQTAPR